MLVLAWTFFQGIDGLVTFYMSNELDASASAIGLYGTIKGVGILAGGIGLAAVVRRGGRRTAALAMLGMVTAGGLGFAGAGEGVATALSDDLGFTDVFRVFALTNLAVIPLMLVVIARFPSRVDVTP